MTRLSQTEWQTAKRVCTPRQLRVLDYWRRGWGSRSIGLALGVSPTTVRDHLAAARRRICDELERAGGVAS